MLQNVMKWFKKNQERVATEVSNSMGKPISQSRKEVDTMIDRAENLFKIAPPLLEDDIIQVDSKTMLKIRKEPLGISFVVTPWNYPLLTFVNHMVASVLTGNPILQRHSVRTPIVGDFFEEAFKDVGATNVVQHLWLHSNDIPSLYKCKDVCILL